MSLRTAAFSAGRWTTASLAYRAGLQIGQAMILARLLDPSDFGLIAVASSLYALISQLIDLGFSNALMHFPQPSRSALSTLYWLNLGAALLMMLCFALLSLPFAAIYKEPMLVPVMYMMSLAMPLNAFGQQFRVMAEKELRFSRLAAIETISATTGFIAALIVALRGGGVYSIIAALLVSAAASSTLAWLLLSKNLRPMLESDFREIRPYLRYGSYRLGEALLNTIRLQADVLIGGAVAGAAAMGTYTLPRDLALRFANTVINPVVTRVGLPLMAKVQNDRTTLKSVYLQTLRLTSSINFPIYAALAVWADEAVSILLGSRWQHSGEYMRLFALWGMIRSVGNPVGSLLYATGQVQRAFFWNLFLLCVTPGLMWTAVQLGGTLALAAALLGIQAAIFYPAFFLLVAPTCGAGFREYIGELVPPLTSSCLAITFGLASSHFFPKNSYCYVAVAGMASTIAYVWISYFLNRAWFSAMSELLRPIFSRSGSLGSPPIKRT